MTTQHTGGTPPSVSATPLEWALWFAGENRMLTTDVTKAVTGVVSRWLHARLRACDMPHALFLWGCFTVQVATRPMPVERLPVMLHRIVAAARLSDYPHPSTAVG